MFNSYRSLQKKSLASLAMAGSGSGCVGFIYNSNTNKSVFPLKLTETVIRQIEGFLNNKVSLSNVLFFIEMGST